MLNETVYAKVYANNNWTWTPGTMMERIGSIMYNVWVNDRRMIRSHVNQLKNRGAATYQSNEKRSLPLDILLSEYNIVKPSSSSSPVQQLRPSSPAQVSPGPRLKRNKFILLNSDALQSAVEASPMIEVPWRSSRNRSGSTPISDFNEGDVGVNWPS